MFVMIRQEGFTPCVVSDTVEQYEDDEIGQVHSEVVEVAMVCPHVISEESRHIYRQEDGTWEWEETSSGFGCPLCSEEGETVCPRCHQPMPALSEAEVVLFYLDNLDILAWTRCPECGSSWLLDESCVDLHRAIDTDRANCSDTTHYLGTG